MWIYVRSENELIFLELGRRIQIYWRLGLYRSLGFSVRLS